MYRVLKFFDDLSGAIVAVLLMLLAVYAGYALWDNQQVYAAAAEVRTSLLEMKPAEDGPSFAALRAVNPDVCAWVTLDGTGVDYPVVQGTDNLTYVNTDVYGNFRCPAPSFWIAAARRTSRRDTACCTATTWSTGRCSAIWRSIRTRRFWRRIPAARCCCRTGRAGWRCWAVC